jgi:hypothetical protein
MKDLRDTVEIIIFDGFGMDGRREGDRDAVTEVVDRLMSAYGDAVNAGVQACLVELIASNTLVKEESSSLGIFYRGRLSGGQREHRDLMAKAVARAQH